jgi:hypothetical protein
MFPPRPIYNHQVVYFFTEKITSLVCNENKINPFYHLIVNKIDDIHVKKETVPT